MAAGRALILFLAAVALSCQPAHAGRLDRVKAAGVVHCGATQRPGLFEVAADGAARGLLVDLCRAIGVAAAGPATGAVMSVYDADASYDALRAGRDDVFFLTGSEIVDHKLAGMILPGPIAYTESSAAMVPEASPARTLRDLAGQPICFLQGEAPHRHLEAYFAARRLPFVRMGYQEPDELYDAFAAWACAAYVGEATRLARQRRGARILDEKLASFPIAAATGLEDGRWAALVAWTLMVLTDADRPKQDWAAGGLDALPIDLSALGLAQDWRQNVLAATGGYAEILRRNLGEASPLRLPPAQNALASQGGLRDALFAE